MSTIESEPKEFINPIYFSLIKEGERIAEKLREVIKPHFSAYSEAAQNSLFEDISDDFNGLVKTMSIDSRLALKQSCPTAVPNKDIRQSKLKLLFGKIS